MALHINTIWKHHTSMFQWSKFHSHCLGFINIISSMLFDWNADQEILQFRATSQMLLTKEELQSYILIREGACHCGHSLD